MFNATPLPYFDQILRIHSTFSIIDLTHFIPRYTKSGYKEPRYTKSRYTELGYTESSQADRKLSDSLICARLDTRLDQ